MFDLHRLNPRGAKTRASNPQRASLRRPPKAVLFGVVLAVSAVTISAYADVGQLAARLAKLRAEVEQLSADLSAKSSESNDTLRSLARQRSELELEVRREETRLQKVSAAIAKQKAEIAEQKEKGQQVVPLLSSVVADVRKQVSASMPFRKDERLAALDKIEEQHKSGLLSATRALSRVWGFVEDELRLTRENGLYKQTVTVDGAPRLAEVARLGMVMMFYRTDDDRVGHAVHENGDWSYEEILDDKQKRAVLDLFTTFKKQVRVGYFELPNALPSITEGASK